MAKFTLKPAWIAGAALLVGAALAIKLALALTAFAPAKSPIGYVGQDEVTSFNLKSGKEVLFRGNYEREFWSGTLFAYRLDSAGNLLPANSESGWWSSDAGDLITAQNPDTGRKIATMKDDGTAVPFRLASLSGTQQGYLSSDNVVNYLRGDRTNEIPASGGTLRQRVSVMGDVVHSRPFYVADDTNPTVFVGANDGMLHAINAGTGASGGKERWAYVPSMLLPKMKSLTVNPYVHDYYVDGQINVATISVSGTPKRVLVGGLGAGGKGLFALNITDSAGLTAASENAVASKVMWEITPTQVNYAAPATTNAYDNLGYTYGTVNIIKVNTGTVGAPVIVDAVIVGNGYNDGGDYGSYLFVINANTGQLIKRFKAGDGTAASPNGLSTPVAVDVDRDGAADIVYAGDLNGTMWKFDLSALSDPTTVATTATSPGGVTLLLATSQPITSTPGVAIHPNGGFMVNFGTGKMLIPGDLTDATVYSAYGIWDGAPTDNDTLLPQTMDERNYVAGGVTTRVRRTTSNQPNWTSGAGNHKGWKVDLPAGERVVGEGSFIENGRFYFKGYNPTKSNKVDGTDTTVVGDNWLMELDYLTGGSNNVPFLDLSGNILLDDLDRLKYIVGDTLPTGKVVGDPILTTDGIPVGKFIAIGVLSQPILVQLVTLNDTLFNQNPDVIVPVSQVDRGVQGGHFDVEIYYGTTTATITVANPATGAGQTNGFPATLGAITVDGVEVIPALTVADLLNGGGSSSTSADVLRKKVVAANGFTASRSGNVITITAPDVSYLGKTMAVADGTSQTLVNAAAAVAAVTAVRPTGFITFTNGPSTANYTISNNLAGPSSVTVNGNNAMGGAIVIGSGKTATQAAAIVAAQGGTGGTYKYYVGGNSITPLCQAKAVTVVCVVDTSTNSNGSNNGKAIVLGNRLTATGLSVATTSTSGGVTGVTGSAAVAKSGWTNFKPAITVSVFDNGGGSTAVSGDTCGGGTKGCTYKQHEHEYDDLYDKTGVNFLNASNGNFNLAKAIPSTSTQFRVIAQNQYLSPAVKLHIGNAGYLFNVDAGYIPIKNFTTTSTLRVADLPVYTRATIGSLAFNLPANAFSSLNWWDGYLGLPADVRDGLHPTEAGCVFNSSSNFAQDGNMYQPVNPPLTVTASSNGTKGYDATTTQLTATGVRHNGALTIQIIKVDTPDSAIEPSVLKPDGTPRPEYGWRVKSAFFSTYVLAEYSTFHHTKHLGLCFGDENVDVNIFFDNVTKTYALQYKNVSWTKTPAKDTRSCAANKPLDTATTKECAADLSKSAGPDPKIGDLGGGSDIASVDTTVVGDVTTTIITYTNTLSAKIERRVKNDGSIVIKSWDVNASKEDKDKGVCTPPTCTEQTIGNKDGAVKSGGDERGLQARTGRISWRELVAP